MQTPEVVRFHQKTTRQLAMLLKAHVVQAFLWQSAKGAPKYFYFSSQCDLLGAQKCQHFTE